MPDNRKAALEAIEEVSCASDAWAFYCHHKDAIKAALSSPQWEDIGSAPMGTRVLVYGNGPCRTGYRDDLGNWRALHHGPLKTQPTHWMPLPLPPAERN